MFYLQQGDIVITPVTSLPDGLFKVPTKVLQEGEFTGHMHQFDAKDYVSVYVSQDVKSHKAITPDMGKFIVVEAPAALRHEEHRPIEVPPGIYKISIVREYDYDKDEARYVVD